MKKVYLTTLLILSMVCTINAQEIKIGAKTGLNLASITGDDVDVSMRPSFHIGGMAEIPVSAEFYVQPELLFSSQGYKVKDNDAVGILNYIALPVIGKYYVTDKLSIEAGPQIGYLLSANIKTDDSPAPNTGGGNVETAAKASNTKASSASTASSAQKQDIKEYFKSIDLAFGIGAGYKLDNGINLSARYNLGVSNISEDSSESIKNSVFMLSVGYFFW
tara:strand:- start:15824 stop:16480 length:657 start_codon:yes stop_codon:yes gene_type:complete